ncbi:MAG TPA: YIP1 family protein [Acidiferrobacter sp.]|nr:YIP1 family protein [Acidiferrobacter sp.]
MKVIWDTVVAVTLRPVAFFKTMPKQGGFYAPFVFLLVVGLFDMLLFSFFVGAVAGPAMGLTFAGNMLVLAPIALTVSGFVLTTVFFVFWRLMGSSQSYEASYRTFVYSYAVSPVTTVIGFIPHLAFVGVVWWFSLLIIGSIYVHGINRVKAVAVFAVLGVALVVFLIRAERYVIHHGLAQTLSQHKLPAAKPAARATQI